ncbi:hypothetical protein [Novosphingobium sp. M1R2S20]|uniref:Uncharacterized protein n=1 Tax=Novosphingobium rhizovicinum TaxID=3228928 RepID=A0ABV3RCV9_9SPHN
MRAAIKIVQIVVDVGDGDLCAVSLSQDRMNMLVGFIEDLSEGPIRVVRLPGVKMVSLSELEEHP